LWGLVNFAVGYFVIRIVGNVDTGISLDMLFFVLGGVAIAFVCARQFGPVQKNNREQQSTPRGAPVVWTACPTHSLGRQAFPRKRLLSEVI